MIGLIVCIFIVVVATAVLAHFRNVRKIAADHNTKMALLKNNIRRQLSQIEIRDSGLNRYDFLKYNLRESLVVQPGIPTDV